jgi:SNF2 family DNA or RNA helicase
MGFLLTERADALVKRGLKPKEESMAPTPEILTVHTALRFLASQCDYAKKRDGCGFNMFDAVLGHALAACDGLSYDQAVAALRMLRKYRQQLCEAGIVLPEAIPAPTLSSEQFCLNGRGGITLRGDALVITFPARPSELDRAFLKTFHGWRYDGITRAWSVPATAAEQVIARFPALPVDPAVHAALAEQKAIQRAEAEQEILLQQTLLSAAGDLTAPLADGTTLYPFQQEGVRRLLHLRRAILADDMGLGKTRQALVAAKAFQTAFDCAIFVICPASLMKYWAREAETVDVRVEIFSWAKIPQAPEAYFALIADEAHYAQAGTKTIRGAAFLTLAAADSCIATYCLTGTPLKNGRPANLFPLLQATRHPLAANKRQYEARYCAAHATRFTAWDTTGAAHLDELHQKIQHIMIRRTKEQCLTDLPPKIRIKRAVEMSTHAHAQYTSTFNHLRAEYRTRVRRGEISSTADALVMLTHLRHAGSMAKVEGAVEMAQEILEQNQQVVIFCEFTDSVQAIAETLRSYGVEVLTGDVPSHTRQEMVDRFQSGRSRVFCATFRVGGVGITLTTASHVILVDRPWTPGDAMQAEDRCHRIGQRGSVHAYWLQANGVDEKIDDVLLQKQERIDLVLKGKRKSLRGVTDVAEVALDLLHDLFGDAPSS